MTPGDWVQVGVALFGAVGSVAVGLIRYFNGRIESERQSREKDRHDARDDLAVVANNFNAFKEKIANEYPSYERLRDLLRPISDGIDEIKGDMRDLFAKLDQKADK